MARQGLLRHRKFIRLARLIGSEPLALGHLEIMWEACYEAGDDVLGSADDLEYLAQWHGEQGHLASMLVESGFVDMEGDVYRVHDLLENAPNYVQARLKRELERKEKGLTLSQLRAEAGKKGGEARVKQMQANEIICLANAKQTQANDTTPSPSPAPSLSPSPIFNTLSLSGDSPCKFAESTAIPAILKTPEFIKAWSAWIDHRAAICKPLTGPEADMQLADMLRRGWDSVRATAAVEFTIANGGRGAIFENDRQAPTKRGKQPTPQTPIEEMDLTRE